jgi:DNA-binding phage protein
MRETVALDVSPEIVPGSPAVKKAKTVQVLRTKRGYSVNRLAELSGVSRATVFRALAGDESVRLDTWAAIAKALGVRLEELG